MSTGQPGGGGDSSSANTAVASSLMTQGEKLFDENCSPCHQKDGKGVPGAFPPLAGNSNLRSAQLVVDTIHHGRSGPITAEGKTFDSTMPPIGAGFSARQTAAVATYVRNAWGNSFGPVPVQRTHDILTASHQGPAQQAKAAPTPTPSPSPPNPLRSLGALQKGGRLFRLNCAPCHGAAAHGGALVFTDVNPPSLKTVSAAAIPAFVRTGPGPMPAFKTAIFSDEDVSAIATYVEAMQSPEHPGGFGIGFLGPTFEGFFAVVCGLGAAVLASFLIELGGRG